MSGSYLDRGDRVVIKNSTNKFGSDDLSIHQGKHGVILENNGWGLCSVELDDGTLIKAWSNADLKRESE